MKPTYPKMHDGKPDSTPAPLFVCPDYLGTYAKECWARLYPHLLNLHGDRLHPVDALNFERFCHTWGERRMANDEAEAHQAAEGSMLRRTGELGAVYQDPALGIAHKADQRLDKLGDILGLNLNTRKAKAAPAAPLRRKPA